MPPLVRTNLKQSQMALAAVLVADELTPAVREKIDVAGIDSIAATALKTATAGEFLHAAIRLGLKPNAQAETTLQLQATQTASANLRALRGFKPVAQALNEAGIPFLLLKGAALHLSLYRRPELRLMTDIDILLQPQATEEAHRVLVDSGCSAGRELVRSDFFPRFYYEREYDMPEPGTPLLDVHAHPLRPLRYMKTIPPLAMWDGSVRAELEGVEVCYPSNENMLIHLAAHSAIHGNTRFIWLHDLVRFVNVYRTDIDFAVVQRRALEWSLSLAVFRALHEAAELFEDQALAECCRAFEYRAAWRDRLVLFQAPRDSAHPIAHIATNLLTTPGFRFRLGYLRAVLFPDQAHMGGIYRWRHPGWLICAHGWRLVRPVLRLVRSALARLRSPAASPKLESAAGRG